ncbi:putative methyltransferase NSUN7 [Sinocyclocheilus grahami]|uniref:putative methyltransferase NSUN7 n=1 Tax=Sinocyclocheilus grahami TaxID=75366 RepID=UPI0007ACEC49|nr:PREDICTED: putative methyltransferase NSUN7 [Sinocyclocheilus grahami]
MSGCFSAQTVAHVSAVAAAASAHTHTETHTSQSDARGQSTVIVCLGDGEQSQTDELQNTLTKLGCKNVKLLPDSLESLDVSDARLQKISVVFLMPACSLSAVSNPVDYIMQENRDPRLMLDLSQGSVSPEKLQMLMCQQRKVLQRAVQFPQVRAVLYSTCSVHPEENEEVLKTVLSQTQENHSTAPPYRLSSPSLLQDSIIEDDEETEEMKARFFRLEASDRSNGCFLALLTREPQPEVIETPQEVLARAAAKGLLDGLQPIKKEGRGRRSHRAPANQKRSVKTRPHATQSDQSRVAEFLNREMKGSSSEPTLSQSPRSPAHYDKPSSSQRPSRSGFSRTGSAPSPAPFSSSYSKSLTRLASVSTNDHHSSPPPAPPKGRQEVLRPATVTFPPVLLSSDGLLPQRWSHALPARPSPAHTNLQWRNSTPALPRSQTPFRLNHLRPWL